MCVSVYIYIWMQENSNRASCAFNWKNLRCARRVLGRSLMVDKMKPGKNHRKNYVYRKKLLGQEQEHCLGVLTSFLVETKEKTLVHNTNSLIAIENEEHVNSYRVHEDSLIK